MKYIIFFLFVYFLSYSSVFALPFAVATPFIIDLAVFFYVLIFSFLSYFIKPFLIGRKFILFFFLIFSCFNTIYIYNMLGYPAIVYMNFHFISITFSYLIFLCLFALLFCGEIYQHYKKKTLFFLQFILIIFLLVHFWIAYNIYKLDTVLDNMMTKFEIFIGEEVTLQSLPMVNHIYATQDFKYPIGGNWNNCRITISYYVHTSKNNAFSITSLKTSSINIYVGNDIKNTCRSIVSQLDLDL